jgi:hypothetical protein
MGYTEHPRCVLADRDTAPHIRGCVACVHTDVAQHRYKAAWTSFGSHTLNLAANIAYILSQPPYTQETVREYKG